MLSFPSFCVPRFNLKKLVFKNKISLSLLFDRKIHTIDMLFVVQTDSKILLENTTKEKKAQSNVEHNKSRDPVARRVIQNIANENFSYRPAQRVPPLLNFTPLNPDNAGNPVEEEASPVETFELTYNRRENGNESSEACKLELHNIPTEFPLPVDSIEGERTKRYIVAIHRELAKFGYALKNEDIASCYPLSNQRSRSSSDI